jgi:hypothetical protein
MNTGSSLDVLIAQIQIKLEGLGNLVVTSPLSKSDADLVAERIVAGFRARGILAGLYLCVSPNPSGTSVPDNPANAHEVGEELDLSPRTFSAAQAGTPQLARSMLASHGTVTVASAPGILQEPSSLFLAAAADAVLLVVQARHTTRSDLKRARLELETAGARLVGAVLSG